MKKKYVLSEVLLKHLDKKWKVLLEFIYLETVYNQNFIVFKISFHVLWLERLFTLNIDLYCVLKIILLKNWKVVYESITSNTVKKFKISSQITYGKSVTISFDAVTLFVSIKGNIPI